MRSIGVVTRLGTGVNCEFESHHFDKLKTKRVKTFIATWRTNYGLDVILINSEDIESAKIIVKEKIFRNEFEIEEVDKLTEGITFFEGS